MDIQLGVLIWEKVFVGQFVVKKTWLDTKSGFLWKENCFLFKGGIIWKTLRLKI